MKHKVDIRSLSIGGTIKTAADIGPAAVVTPIEPGVDLCVRETKSVPIDPAKITGGVEEIVTLDLLNESGEDLVLFLGTPFGTSDIVGVGGSPDGTFNFNAGGSDRTGASSAFLTSLCNRVVRRPLIVSKMSILTANDTSGLTQRSNRVTRKETNYNADQRDRAGLFLRFFEENNYVVADALFSLSDDWGITYTINDDENVKIDLEILTSAIYDFNIPDTNCV